MAKIQPFKGYSGPTTIPKPAEPVQPNIVTAADGCPVKYPGCEGIGVRVVHPSNPKASSKSFGLQMFYLPPHVVLEPGSHENEECYVIVRGKGTMTLAGKRVEVTAGQFIHLPSWCEHGVENTGHETLEIMICTCPPFP